MKKTPAKKSKTGTNPAALDAVVDAVEPAFGIPQRERLLSVRELLVKIDFSPDNVVQAAAENSVLFSDAIDHRVKALEAKAAAKMSLESVQAEFDVEMRRTARELDEKITEKQIESAKLLDEVVNQHMTALVRAETMDEYMRLLLEAYRMRRDCLQIVAGLVRSDLSLQNANEVVAEKMAAIRQKMREKFPGRNEE